ncbi:ABC transporter permease [Actinomadura luteofluorescens]|uniref:ABC transporter permease n=1 Tax=Actinomadura luteofluorescens TaxID=46163 RepID=UPI003636A6B8
MTALTAPATRAGRLLWALTDGLTLIGRELGRIRQEPGELVAALIFPAIMVVLFGYVFGSAISVPGGGNYREYLMPGLFAMVTFTSTMAVTMRVATDASRGVMDRFRSMPMARSAVPFGQTGAEILNGVLGMVIMAVAGLVVGWRAHNGLWQTAEAFALLALMRYALSWAAATSAWWSRTSRPPTTSSPWSSRSPCCPTPSSPPAACPRSCRSSPNGTPSAPSPPPAANCSATPARPPRPRLAPRPPRPRHARLGAAPARGVRAPVRAHLPRPRPLTPTAADPHGR